MKCPYCVSIIDDEALVCKECGRDLYLFKPLLHQITELETQVAHLAELEAENKMLHEQLATVSTPDVAVQSSAILTLMSWLGAALTPLLLLMAAHWLIIILYDLNPLYLRIVSLLIPLPFAFVLAKGRGVNPVLGAVVAAAMGAVAVVGMSWLTSRVDLTPVLPQNFLEWREFAEFSASVAFSFVTGLLIGSSIRNQRQARRGLREQRPAWMAKVVEHLGIGDRNMTLPEKVERLYEVGGTLMTVGTTVISVYTGLKGFLG